MGEVGAKSGEQFFDEKSTFKKPKCHFRHFCVGGMVQFLRGDYTHPWASFKPLITKIGDRPVRPYTWETAILTSALERVNFLTHFFAAALSF